MTEDTVCMTGAGPGASNALDTTAHGAAAHQFATEGDEAKEKEDYARATECYRSAARHFYLASGVTSADQKRALAESESWQGAVEAKDDSEDAADLPISASTFTTSALQSSDRRALLLLASAYARSALLMRQYGQRANPPPPSSTTTGVTRNGGTTAPAQQRNGLGPGASGGGAGSSGKREEESGGGAAGERETEVSASITDSVFGLASSTVVRKKARQRALTKDEAARRKVDELLGLERKLKKFNMGMGNFGRQAQDFANGDILSSTLGESFLLLNEGMRPQGHAQAHSQAPPQPQSSSSPRQRPKAKTSRGADTARAAAAVLRGEQSMSNSSGSSTEVSPKSTMAFMPRPGLERNVSDQTLGWAPTSCSRTPRTMDDVSQRDGDGARDRGEGGGGGSVHAADYRSGEGRKGPDKMERLSASVLNADAATSGLRPRTGAGSRAARYLDLSQTSEVHAEQVVRLLRSMKQLSDENAKLLAEQQGWQRIKAENEAMKDAMQRFRADFDKRLEDVRDQLVAWRRRYPHDSNPTNAVHSKEEAKKVKELEMYVRQMYAMSQKQKKKLKELAQENRKKDEELTKYHEWHKARQRAKAKAMAEGHSPGSSHNAVHGPSRMGRIPETDEVPDGTPAFVPSAQPQSRAPGPASRLHGNMPATSTPSQTPRPGVAGMTSPSAAAATEQQPRHHPHLQTTPAQPPQPPQPPQSPHSPTARNSTAGY